MRLLAGLLVAQLVAAGGVEAHAPDEYVQALRVSVAHDRIAMFLDLTPGANIVAEVVRRIDVNVDGRVSPNEAETYGRAVLAGLTLSVDGQPVPLSVTRVDLPPIGEMLDGQSVIRLELMASTNLSGGAHRLIVHNAHLPRLSVYLANALLPDTPDVRIVAQTRDARQQTFVLDYELRASDVAALTWLAIGGFTLLCLITFRTTTQDVGVRMQPRESATGVDRGAPLRCFRPDARYSDKQEIEALTR